MCTLIFQIIGYSVLAFAIIGFLVIVYSICVAGKQAEIMEDILNETHEDL